MKAHFYNPVLTVVNGGQFYDVEYSVWDRGVKSSQSVSFRSYDEAKSFFNTIPLT
jgi:hypothetical protein